ncbi:MAG: SagB family peptide dehydrogenase [Candidatus Eremiobacterota bacterium]
MKNLVLTFREDMNISEGNEGDIFLQNDILSLNIDRPSQGIKTFIEKLNGDGGTEDELADMVTEMDGLQGVSLFYYYLERFFRLSVICRTIYYNGKPFATIEPFSYYFIWKDSDELKDEKFILSRFALIRREKNRFIMESPLSFCRIILHNGFDIINFLYKEHTREDIYKLTGMEKHTVNGFLSLLVNNNFLVKPEEEENNETLQQWEFHDLLFHSRHRIGRHNYPNGATYPFLNKIDPQPAFKKPAGTGINLFKPDMEKLMTDDYPFSLIVEERESVRSYGDIPVTVEQLGEFLYRTYRVKEVKDSADGGEMYQVTVRPCAGGGACYELEIYPVINKCEGLSSGIYHYDPVNHRLHRLTERNETVEALINRAHVSAVKLCYPEILLIITARFQRVSWKYRGMAYATILKNVGVLYQNMYLIATAMELSPCALGNGDADLFCRAAGLDYLSESPVGEFMLGRKRI